MSTATEPRRLTGPWDEKIVKAYAASKAFLGYSCEGWTTEQRQHARRTSQYVPGEPATMSIGSDSYAMMIVAVDRYKSGPHLGEVKAIHAVHRNYDGSIRPEVEWDWTGDEPTYTYGVQTFTRRDRRNSSSTCWRHRPDAPVSRFDDDSADCYSCWEQSQPRFIEKGNDYCSLIVGYAHDYRDPHF